MEHVHLISQRGMHIGYVYSVNTMCGIKSKLPGLSQYEASTYNSKSELYITSFKNRIDRVFFDQLRTLGVRNCIGQGAILEDRG